MRIRTTRIGPPRWHWFRRHSPARQNRYSTQGRPAPERKGYTMLQDAPRNSQSSPESVPDCPDSGPANCCSSNNTVGTVSTPDQQTPPPPATDAAPDETPPDASDAPPHDGIAILLDHDDEN